MSQPGQWVRWSPGFVPAKTTPTSTTTRIAPERTRSTAATGRVAIALVTHDSSAVLHRFLDQQLDAAAQSDATVVVVDNGSSDGSLELLRSRSRDGALLLIENPDNRGYAAAVNQAFAVVPGSDVFVANPDLAFESAALDLLTEFIERHPRAGVVGPRLLGENGAVQASARRFPSPLAMAGNSSAARRLRGAQRATAAYLNLPDGSRPSRVDWVLGAAMLVRRAAYEEVGGWDPGYFLYLEDTDFCLRLQRAGWDTWYLPEAEMRHLHARESRHTRGSVISSRSRRAHVRSMVRFFVKHRDLVSGRHLDAAD